MIKCWKVNTRLFIGNLIINPLTGVYGKIKQLT